MFNEQQISKKLLVGDNSTLSIARTQDHPKETAPSKNMKHDKSIRIIRALSYTAFSYGRLNKEEEDPELVCVAFCMRANKVSTNQPADSSVHRQGATAAWSGFCG